MRLACLAFIVFLGSCSSDLIVAQNAALMNDSAQQLWATEELISLAMNELWIFSGPPAPARILFRPCVESHCSHPSSSQIVLERQNKGCTAGTAFITGKSRLTVSGASDLAGCATSVGPPVFNHWPPAFADVLIEIGIGTSFDRNEPKGVSSQSSGTIRVRFEKRDHVQGAMAIDMTATVTNKLRQSEKYRFVSDQALELLMPNYSDYEKRGLSGAIRITGGDRAAATAFLDNVVFEKPTCCHPLSGRLIFDRGPNEPVFILHFTPTCGQAWLSEPPANVQSVRLTGCAS